MFTHQKNESESTVYSVSPENCTPPEQDFILCSSCNDRTDPNFAFCQNCGAPMAEAPIAKPSVVASKKKRRAFIMAIISGGIIAVVALALVFFLPLIKKDSGKISKNDYAIYLKDSELFFTDLEKGDKSTQLSTRLLDTIEYSDEDLVQNSNEIADATCISKDGKFIFFADRYQEDQAGYNLYYKETDALESEAVKIDSNVRTYYLNDSTSVATYVKGEENTLYQYQIDTDTKEKIANNVTSFHVTQDGKKIVYVVTNYTTNKEGREISSYDLYMKNADDNGKIAGDISFLEYVSEDLSIIYYTKDNSLYKYLEGEEKTKIATDVSQILKIYDTGEIYYTKGEIEEVPLANFIVDDMQKADAAITRPEYPDYPYEPDSPSWWYYDTDAEYEAAYATYKKNYDSWEKECARLTGEYEAAYKNYQAKVERDELREELSQKNITQYECSLYFYDGTDENIITDTLREYSNSHASEASVITYLAYNHSKLKKVNLSQIEDVSKAFELVRSALSASAERFVAVGKAPTLIEKNKGIYNFSINSSGTAAYYFDNIPDEESHGELYRISIADGIVGQPELYDTDVFTEYTRFLDNNFIYFKDVNDDTWMGDLYIDKKTIDYDVYIGTVCRSEQEQLVYITDWNSEKEYGTLKLYDDEKAIKIADDVHLFDITPKGRILYLYDYSPTYYSGELHEWFNNESKKIDDDVISLLVIKSYQYNYHQNNSLYLY